MANKRISGRELRHGAPEESLSPGQSLFIEKRGGKRFELTRIDSGAVDLNEQMDHIFKEIPIQGGRSKTNMVRDFLEDRE